VQNDGIMKISVTRDEYIFQLCWAKSDPWNYSSNFPLGIIDSEGKKSNWGSIRNSVENQEFERTDKRINILLKSQYYPLGYPLNYRDKYEMAMPLVSLSYNDVRL
jgi:hypothetical protein